MDNEALINGYFEDNLSENEKGEFERLLNTDSEFAADFEFQKELQRSLKKEERQQIKAMFGAQNPFAEKTPTKVVRLRPWLMAASIALLVGISAWLIFFTNTGIDAGQLYDTNFVPYENVVHPIERGAQIEDLKTKAFTAYEDEDYGNALALFKELQQKQADSYIQFYEAIVLMQLNKHQEAVPLLENYISGDGELKDRAIWYLALAYLKQGDTSKSSEQLEKLIKEDGFKAKAARQLLENL